MGKIKLLLGASILLFVSGQVNASLITDGSLYRLTNPLITDSFATVDKWNFSTPGGTAKIDVLSWETRPFVGNFSGGPVQPIDANGDGEIAFFDSLIHIFRDDGVLDPTDWVSSVDDSLEIIGPFGDPYCRYSSGNAGFADGSIWHYDSCMETDLGAGDYLLAIGIDKTTIAEAIAGVSLIKPPTKHMTNGNNAAGPQTCISNSGDPYGPSSICLENNSYGDYQITWGDNLIVTSNPDSTYIPAVPVPAAVWLFGTALIGLIGFSKRRKAA